MVYEKKYSWRAGKSVSAQVAGEVMEMIEKRDGELTKEAFLEESRPEDSPTHGLFEWDDAVASEKPLFRPEKDPRVCEHDNRQGQQGELLKHSGCDGGRRKAKSSIAERTCRAESI